MLIALIWWSVLLYTKNAELYAANMQIMTELQGSNSGALESLTEKFKRQKGMIIGEGLTFGLMLVIGILLIIRSYNKELQTAQKENNFLLSITHELKSPIASIQLILDTFKKRTLKPTLFEELNDNALEETSRLNALVGNLLYANKLNYGQEYHFEVLDLSTELSDVVNHLKKSHQNIQFDIGIEEGIMANVDIDAIRIALNNLLENAIKYSSHSKVIGVDLHQNKTIELQIKDQGVGIPAEEKSKIFSKFYRVGNEDTRDTKGTGLGLYICKEIVEGHDGDIRVLDNKPKGSIFKITLPKYYG